MARIADVIGAAAQLGEKMKTKVTLDRDDIEKAIVYWMKAVYNMDVKPSKDHLDTPTKKPKIQWTDGDGGGRVERENLKCTIDVFEKKDLSLYPEYRKGYNPLEGNRG